MSQLEKRGKDEKWREINIVGLAGASCFIWQIAAQYPYGPVITQESRANKEKSRPLLPLFLLSNTFSHSPSIRYKPFSFLFLGTHCLLSFLPPPSPPPNFLQFVPFTVCPPRGYFFKTPPVHSKRRPWRVASRHSCSLGEDTFYRWCKFRSGKGLQKSPL